MDLLVQVHRADLLGRQRGLDDPELVRGDVEVISQGDAETPGDVGAFRVMVAYHDDHEPFPTALAEAIDHVRTRAQRGIASATAHWNGVLAGHPPELARDRVFLDE